MFKTINLVDHSFDTIEECKHALDQRVYENIVCHSNDCTIEHDGINVGDTKYPMYDVFVDAVFGNTGLPRKNETILPIENVEKDINTLLHGPSGDTVSIKLLNGTAYTMFKAGAKGIRQPLNHKQFIETLSQNIETKDVKRVDLTSKMLRVTTYDDQMTQEVLQGDFHHFGIDYANGEIYKSQPLTVGMMLYRISCSNSAVAPFDDKYVKLKASDSPESMMARLSEICQSMNIDYDMIKDKITNLSKIGMNSNLLKLIASNMGYVPQEVKEQMFHKFYQTDEDGKVTKIIKAGAFDGLSLFDMYNEITRIAHQNASIGKTSRYRMESFAGSLLNTNSRKLVEAIEG